jgi:L-fuculose-phosphate aldolase
MRGGRSAGPAPGGVDDAAAVARQAIVRVAQALDHAGLMPSKSGNVSCRADAAGGFLVTPAGLPYAVMTAEDVVALAPDGAVLAGRHRPSSEWRLHAAVYAARPDAGAVVHTHSPKATALSCARRGIPAFHYTVALAGGEIRCGNYATYGTPALAAAAVRALEDRRAALMANHGALAIGPTLAAAHALALEVENLASEYLAVLAAGLEPVLLTEAEMAEVAAQFAEYGRLG